MFRATERLPGMSYVESVKDPRAHALWEAERIEMEAWTDILHALPTALAHKLGVFVLRERGLVALHSPGIEHVLFNRAFVTSAGAVGPARIAQVVGAYRALGISRYFLHLHEHALDTQVRSSLHATGLVRYPRAWVKLGCTLHSVKQASSAFEIARVTHARAEPCADIVTRGFDLPESATVLFRALAERPRWHLYAALDGGRPVATAGLFVDGGSAYLAFASTLPEYRRLGAQSALLERRLRVALALGATFVASETGEPAEGDPQHSYRNLTRAGLMPLAVRQNWALPGTRW